MSWLLLLVACQGGTDDTGYLGQIEQSTLPTFNAAAVEAAIAAAMVEARSITAAPVFDAYAEITEGAMDGDCPDWLVSYDGTPYWYDNCTSDNGTSFAGYTYEQPNVQINNGGIMWQGNVLYGLATITSPDGDTFFAPGRAGLFMGYTWDGSVAWGSILDAGFAYDGPAATGSWLADGASPALTSMFIRHPNTGVRATVVDGWFLSDVEGIEAVAFEDIQASESGWGTGCTAEPSGSISVLGPEGLWMDLVFDGPDYTMNWNPESSCDGCGEAWFEGTHLGTACIDSSTLTDWGDSPWEM